MKLEELRDRKWCIGANWALALLFVAAAAIPSFALQNTNKAKSAIEGDKVDIASIRQTLDAYTQAWNRYDPHAMAMLFTEDCDYVVVSGNNTHSREALEKMFAANFANNLKNSTRTDDLRRLYFLTPTIASLDDYWVLNVPGTDQPRREGYYHWVLLRQTDGRWLVFLHHAAQFPTPLTVPAK